ncbi:hypothetical protein BH10PSE8_BH10PSE8_04450 [soil metagenome]
MCWRYRKYRRNGVIMRILTVAGGFACGLLLASPALAELSADSYTWSADVHVKQGGIERMTLIDARQKGDAWTVQMECIVVDKAFRQPHVQRFTGMARWEAGLMLGTLSNDMNFTIANRADGDLAVMTSGDFCASGRGLIGSGDASYSPDTAAKSAGPKGWSHNGSVMQVSKESGRIVYEDPKPSIAGTVSRGTTLFEGRFDGKRVSGTAYVFKKGCDPAPYPVAGSLERDPNGAGERLVLSGPAPKRDRNSCAIVGKTSTHSRLVFELNGDI